MSKFIAAGHICLDITPKFPSGRKVQNIDEMLQPGALVHMEPADISTGGSVANTGLCMKLLGADVRLMGKVGNDDFGKTIEAILARHGVSGLIVDDKSSTSYSVVLAIPGLDRMFLHHPGANDTFCNDDIPESALEGVELFHFGYPPLMKRIYENDGEELVKIFKRVKARGGKVSLDMAAVDPDSEEGRVDWDAFLRNVLPYVDYFLPSRDEIRFMSGLSEPEEIIKKMLGYGAKTVVVKCATKGIYYGSETENGYQPCYRAPFIVSGTGAGDTSIGAFLVAAMQGRSLKECAAFAAMQGRCCVTAYNAIDGLKTMPELEKMIEDAEREKKE